LKSFDEVVDGVLQMLEPARLADFRKNVAALDNRAIFEIPQKLAKLLGESKETAERSATPAIHTQTTT